MNTDCGHSVRNLKLTRNRAQALRVYPKHLCHGALRRARSDSRQLLRPLDLLHAGPAAGAFESGGRRRARHVRGHPALLFARTREPRPARARGRDERAAGRVRGGRDRRAAGQLHAGRRNLEIPRHHRVGGFEYGQPCAEPHRPQPRPPRRSGRGDGAAGVRRLDGGLCGRLHGTLFGGDVGAQHFVPRQRQVGGLRLFRFDLLGRRRPSHRGAGRTVEVRRSAARTRGRDHGLLAVFSRRRADRLG